MPDGFTGPVIIFTDCPQGLPKEYDDWGYKIFRIPESGVMYTQFDYPRCGDSFYYLRNGKLVEIEYLMRHTHLGDDTVAYFMTVGNAGRGKATVENPSLSEENANYYSFMEFIIGNNEMKYYKKQDSLFREVIKDIPCVKD